MKKSELIKELNSVIELNEVKLERLKKLIADSNDAATTRELAIQWELAENRLSCFKNCLEFVEKLRSLE